MRRYFVLLAVGVTLVFFAIFGLQKWRLSVTSAATIVSIVGTFPTQSTEQPAAILRLSQDMKEYPKAKTFLITAKDSADAYPNLIIKYERGRLDDKVNNVINQGFFTHKNYRSDKKYYLQSSVLEKAIHQTANQNGNFDDLWKIQNHIQQIVRQNQPKARK